MAIDVLYMWVGERSERERERERERESEKGERGGESKFGIERTSALLMLCSGDERIMNTIMRLSALCII